MIRTFPRALRPAQPTLRRDRRPARRRLFTGDGACSSLREDVGRHNAVDKVVGWALPQRGLLPLAGHVLLVSGRISYEIVQKALAARIPLVAAISAPTSLAVELAEQAGIGLVGFLRGDTLNVYANARVSRVTGSMRKTDRARRGPSRP